MTYHFLNQADHTIPLQPRCNPKLDPDLSVVVFNFEFVGFFKTKLYLFSQTETTGQNFRRIN